MTRLELKQLIREEINKEINITRRKLIESKKRKKLREGLFDIIGKIFSKGKSSSPEESEKVSADDSGVMYNGKKYRPDQIQYADYNDTKTIPRVEGSTLIVANPYWE